MIFLVLGTQKFQLDRLLKKIDELVATNIIKEEVFAQIGHSTYLPKNYEYTPFLEKDLFEDKIKSCKLLITHSGVSTIMAGIKNEKPVIVFPRREKYNEHVDDHQLEISRAFQKKELILLCENEESISEMITLSKTYEFKEFTSQTDLTTKAINKFISNKK